MYQHWNVIDPSKTTTVLVGVCEGLFFFKGWEERECGTVVEYSANTH